jgi:hypothetical protein
MPILAFARAKVPSQEVDPSLVHPVSVGPEPDEMSAGVQLNKFGTVDRSGSESPMANGSLVILRIVKKQRRTFYGAICQNVLTNLNLSIILKAGSHTREL